MYPLKDVFGDMKDVTGVEDMMTGVKWATGAEKGAEDMKNDVR